MIVVIATKNPGKVREIVETLDATGIQWKTLADFPAAPEPEETGATFAENALLKARYYLAHTGAPVLAEDSGLEVDALGGRPGIYSARYAGEPSDDDANNAKLLEALAGVAPAERTARYRSAFALALPDGRVESAEGTVEGRIADAPAGTNGFGYDPLFIPEGHHRTFGRLGPGVKRAISHRQRALRALLPKLRAALAELHPA